MNPALHPAQDLAKHLGVFKLTLPHPEYQNGQSTTILNTSQATMEQWFWSVYVSLKMW